MAVVRRLAVALLVAGAAGLAACGSSGPKIKDASFVTRCAKAVKTSALTDAQKQQICSCVQQRAVGAGMGDAADTADLSSDKKRQLDEFTTTCTLQTAAGGGGGGGGTGGATSTSP